MKIAVIFLCLGLASFVDANDGGQSSETTSTHTSTLPTKEPDEKMKKHIKSTAECVKQVEEAESCTGSDASKKKEDACAKLIAGMHAFGNAYKLNWEKLFKQWKYTEEQIQLFLNGDHKGCLTHIGLPSLTKVYLLIMQAVCAFHGYVFGTYLKIAFGVLGGGPWTVYLSSLGGSLLVITGSPEYGEICSQLGGASTGGSYVPPQTPPPPHTPTTPPTHPTTPPTHTPTTPPTHTPTTPPTHPTSAAKAAAEATEALGNAKRLTEKAKTATAVANGKAEKLDELTERFKAAKTPEEKEAAKAALTAALEDSESEVQSVTSSVTAARDATTAAQGAVEKAREVAKTEEEKAKVDALEAEAEKLKAESSAVLREGTNALVKITGARGRAREALKQDGGEPPQNGGEPPQNGGVKETINKGNAELAKANEAIERARDAAADANEVARKIGETTEALRDAETGHEKAAARARLTELVGEAEAALGRLESSQEELKKTEAEVDKITEELEKLEATGEQAEERNKLVGELQDALNITKAVGKEGVNATKKLQTAVNDAKKTLTDNPEHAGGTEH